jgi:hypothetical protein
MLPPKFHFIWLRGNTQGVSGMIPLYNLRPLGIPKIIASKLKFPITVLSIFPENVHQRCRFYTTL